MRLRATVLVLSLAGVGLSPARSDEPLNLLLFTIDTLRADHLSCNGSEKVRTPNIDRLAREGVNFTRARSPVPLTLPAHASILTGNYPPTHTVRSNGDYLLPDEQISLAEVLSDLGYRSAAIVSSFVLDRRFGLAQGFEHYDDRVASGVEEIENLEAERTADEVLVAFDALLAKEGPAGPRFFWIHLYDPHAPYDPPEPYRSEYPADLYSGEVAYADDVVGRILTRLESEGLLSSTLIAVVGDHGEGLGDHGEHTHSLLIYNSTLHVPMILWGPGVVPQGRRVDSLVRLIDLAPTLLDYFGVKEGIGEGVSLRSLIEGDSQGAPAASLTAYSESLYPERALGWSPLRGLESSDYRLILAPTPELYAMGEDAPETENRTDSAPDVFKTLKRQLGDLVRAFEVREPTPAVGELDAATRTQLESLGYVTGSSGATSQSGVAMDPKDGIDLWNRIQVGIAQFGQGDLRAAVATFESVLQDDPDIPLVYEFLGSCWQKLSEAEQAEKVYRAALEKGIESPRVHHELGRILMQKGDQGGAERELQMALALDPRSVMAHYDLGNLYRSQKRLDQAGGHYGQALALNPIYLWAWNGLAMTLAAQGQMRQATEAFRKVVEIDPEGAPGVFNLAVQLERSGFAEEAVLTYRKFLELQGSDGLEAQRRLANQALERLNAP